MSLSKEQMDVIKTLYRAEPEKFVDVGDLDIEGEDFEKPCVIKAKIIHSEEKEFESETSEFFGEQNSDEFSNLRTLLEELELELVNLNLTFSQKRKDGLEIDLNKAKLISELEWEIRDIKSRINSE